MVSYYCIYIWFLTLCSMFDIFQLYCCAKSFMLLIFVSACMKNDCTKFVILRELHCLLSMVLTNWSEDFTVWSINIALFALDCC